MEFSCPENARVLVIDDDPEICSTIQDVMVKWGLQAHGITSPSKAMNHLKKSPYNLIMLDIVLPKMNGLDLIPEIKACCPEAKIITMTGFADKDKAVKALRQGSFDFLEKPFDFDLLRLTIRRALGVQQAEIEHRKTLELLERHKRELERSKLRLQQANTQLVETNQALSTLAQNIERTRKETERQMVIKTRSLILPVIEQLSQYSDLERYRNEFDLLLLYVNDLTAGIDYDLQITTTLTSTELRIAALVKNGLSSDAIAGHMNISPSTVKTHRTEHPQKAQLEQFRPQSSRIFTFEDEWKRLRQGVCGRRILERGRGTPTTSPEEGGL